MEKVDQINKIYSREIICDVYCEDESDKLSNLELLKDLCMKSLSESKCEAVKERNCWYQFDNTKDNTLHQKGGITGVIILQESHFHISTWPEDNFFQLNINTCGDKAKPMRALHEIIRHFNISDYTFDIIKRG